MSAMGIEPGAFSTMENYEISGFMEQPSYLVTILGCVHAMI